MVVRSRSRSGFLTAAVLESLETRLLFSAYTLSTVDHFTGPNGSTPFMSDLIADANRNLYGITQAGGPATAGVVFTISFGSSTITPIATFNGDNGSGPNGTLVLDSSGNLYGVTGGGNGNSGTVFMIPAGTHTVATIATFDADTDGSSPLGLTVDANGDLYGVAQNGGPNDLGTVFKVVKGSGAITVIASFDDTDGSIPEGNVLVDANGNIYGTAERGGGVNAGTVWKIASGTNTISVIAEFDGDNGESPMGPIVMDAQGNIFGATQFGGAHQMGEIYEIASGTNTITTLASCTDTSGTNPFMGLVMDSNGNIFGTMVGGGANSEGTVFELPAGSGTLVPLASFSGLDGRFPGGNLVIDPLGVIYGTARGGDDNDDGVVFKLTPTTATQLNFAQQPVKTIAGETLGTLTVRVEDAQGNLVNSDASSVTLSIAGGPNGAVLGGTLTANVINGMATFNDITLSGAGTYTLQATDSALTQATTASFSVIGSPLQALASFDSGTGSDPANGPVIDAQGNLFGVTNTGGTNGVGAVWELSKGSGTITTLASFDGTNGANPDGLIIDANGNLFGVTTGGGANSVGTVFEIASGSSAITMLAAFDGTNGASPYGKLALDSSGNLFGISYAGGASSHGAVYELASGSGTITALASFAHADFAGFHPDGIVVDASGNLFGVTAAGGTNHDGSVFEVVSGSGVITTLASFNDVNGRVPRSLLMDSNGNLYGVTLHDDEDDNGTLFVLAKGSGAIGTVAFFPSDSDGPEQVVMDSQGNFYGSTWAGGTHVGGNIWKIAAGSGEVTTLASLQSSTGTMPLGVIVDAAGNVFGTANTGGANGVGTIFRLALAPAAQLAFGTQPSTTTAGQTISSVTVNVQDADGYTVAADDSMVTLSIFSGPNGGMLEGTLTVQAHDGVATFGDLSLLTPGTYTLSAEDDSLTSAVSNALSINQIMPAPASTKLTFGHQPGNVAAGAMQGSPVTVLVKNASGQVVSADQSQVMLSIMSGPDGATLQGTWIVQAVNGVATFNDVWFPTAGSYTLVATDATLTAVISSKFTVSPGAPSHMAFIQDPTDVKAGAAISPGISVALTDVFGNLATNNHATVTLSFAGGAGGATLKGSLTATVNGGVAKFSNISISRAGTYTLHASGAGKIANSAHFTVSPGAAAKLVFVQQPTAAGVSSTINPTIVVAVQDGFGNQVAVNSSTVLLSIKSGPAGALGGTVSSTVVNGVAVFTGVTLSSAGTYMLKASNGVFSVASSSFVIGGGASAGRHDKRRGAAIEGFMQLVGLSGR